MRRSWVVVLLGLLTSTPALAQWVAPPPSVRVEMQRRYLRDGMVVEEIVYPVQVGKETCRIFGYVCRPAGRARLPALLIIHGGGGTVDVDSACTWARGGYVVLGIDLPGKGEGRPGSRSTGPDMDVENLFRVTPDCSRNYLVYAVAAARNGISALAQRADVDPARIGMVGLSWGGVVTLLTNGQDGRLRAAVDVFGAAWLREGSTWQRQLDAMPPMGRLSWDKFIDPSNFLGTQHAPLLMMTGTNDHCFYLPTFQKTASKVRRDLLLLPNVRHVFTARDRATVLAWLDARLRSDASWTKISMQAPLLDADGNPWISVLVKSPAELARVSLQFTREGPRRWTAGEWQSLPCTVARRGAGVSRWIVRVPRDLIKPEIQCCVTAEDVDGRAASTPVHTLLALEGSYALSSPIVNINRHEMPLVMAGTGLRLSRMIILDPRISAYRLVMPKNVSTSPAAPTH